MLDLRDDVLAVVVKDTQGVLKARTGATGVGYLILERSLKSPRTINQRVAEVVSYFQHLSRRAPTTVPAEPRRFRRGPAKPDGQ